MVNFLSRSFDDPEFKEDSVREVIIAPLLARLGYHPSGDDSIVRSRSLKHPFIYVGTRKLPVTLIPDYTLLADGVPKVVIDAKRPSEDILINSNVQQVYSYAIHPEIKCDHFALCNGRKLVVFHIDSSKPVLNVNFSNFETDWEKIQQYLSPRFVRQPALRKFAPDLGLAFKRLGLVTDGITTILGVRLGLVSRVNDTLITSASNVDFIDIPHCATFDFSPHLLDEILAGLPAPLAVQFKAALGRAPFMAAAELTVEVDVDVRLGKKVEVELETFIPFFIERVLESRFFHSPTPDRQKDLPPEIFKMRDAYKVK